MSCEFCEPYHQKLIEGENGFCAITKNGELFVYPKAEGVNSAVKIRRLKMDDFRNKVIEELNKEVKTSNCKVELEYYDYFVDDLGNYYINTKFSGALRRIQERVCKAFDFISKPKIMRASELVLRSLEINAGPKLTFPEEIELLTRMEEIKESMSKRIEKLHIEVTIK